MTKSFVKKDFETFGGDIVNMLPLILKKEAIVKILKTKMDEFENDKNAKITKVPNIKAINSLRDIRV